MEGSHLSLPPVQQVWVHVTRRRSAAAHQPRYRQNLTSASTLIREICGGNLSEVLIINLGPKWMDMSVYSAFGNNVVEVPFTNWESPPGIGLCPLDVLFTVCSSISSWLKLNDDHIVVRSSRSSRISSSSSLLLHTHSVCTHTGVAHTHLFWHWTELSPFSCRLLPDIHTAAPHSPRRMGHAAPHHRCGVRLGGDAVHARYVPLQHRPSNPPSSQPCTHRQHTPGHPWGRTHALCGVQGTCYHTPAIKTIECPKKWTVCGGVFCCFHAAFVYIFACVYAWDPCAWQSNHSSTNRTPALLGR